MIVYLHRHGQAESLSHSDAARSLTEVGSEHLRRGWSVWRRMVPCPDRVLCSPLRRARQTATILSEATGFAGDLDEEQALSPEAPPVAIIDRLTIAAAEGARSVALVGHQPHLGDLLGLLLTGSDRHAVPLHVGMLVALEIERPSRPLGRLLFALSLEAAAALA